MSLRRAAHRRWRSARSEEAETVVDLGGSRGSAYGGWVLAVKGRFAVRCATTNQIRVDHRTLRQCVMACATSDERAEHPC